MTADQKKTTSKKTAYDIQYAKNNIKRIPLDVQKDHYEKIKAAADKVGEKVNTYIKTAIDMRIDSESSKE